MPDHSDDEIILGSKRIHAGNFASADVTRMFGIKSEAEWIAFFSEPKLDADIPDAVLRLFELARGTMVYGWFYYPLLTLGYAECTRTLEAGARHAAAMAGLAPAPERQRLSYENVIRLLHGKGLIGATRLDAWNIGRQIRNSFAHPTAPTILLPSYASAKLRRTAEQLNALFSSV